MQKKRLKIMIIIRSLINWSRARVKINSGSKMKKGNKNILKYLKKIRVRIDWVEMHSGGTCW